MPAVFFDLDGTLHDRARGIMRFAGDQFDRLVTLPSLRDRFIDRFIELDTNGKVWKDRVYRTLSEGFEFVGRPSVNELVNDYLDAYPRYAAATRGATDALCALALHNIKLGIITNGRSEPQRAVINALGFADCLDAIIISDEVGSRKPHAGIFEIALERVCATATETIMVGDDLLSDIIGALAVGIHPIAYRCSSVPPDVPVFQSMTEVAHSCLLRFGISTD